MDEGSVERLGGGHRHHRGDLPVHGRHGWPAERVPNGLARLLMWYARRLAYFKAKIDKDIKIAVQQFGVATYIGIDDFHDARTNGQAVAVSLRATAERLNRSACRYDRLGAVERVAGRGPLRPLRQPHSQRALPWRVAAGPGVNWRRLDG